MNKEKENKSKKNNGVEKNHSAKRVIVNGNKWNKYLHLERYPNLPTMLMSTVKRFGNKVVARWFDDVDKGTYFKMTYNELWNLVKYTFYGLDTLGVDYKTPVAICSKTRIEWIYADFGVQSHGGFVVAVYPSLKPAEIRYILKDSSSKGIFVDTEENLEKIIEIYKELPDLKFIIIIDSIKDDKKKQDYLSRLGGLKLLELKELLAIGQQEMRKDEDKRQSPEESLFIKKISKIQEDDLASFIYTSGTTGIPKGTMLTHKNFLSDATAAIAVAATSKRHQKPWEMDFLTIMPFSHSFARCVDEYCALYIGASINFTGGYNPKNIQKGFEIFKPKVMTGIPYLYQKIYQIILDEVDRMPPNVRKLFNNAMKIADEYYNYLKQGKKIPLGLKIKYKTLTKLIASQVKKKLGGKLLLMISGSAAISPELVSFFYKLGFDLLEGYGLTETSPVTHLLRTEFNSNYRPNFHKIIPHYQKLGTIGPPIEIVDNPYENVQQKLSEFGELLIKGPMVMKGYWNKPERTAEALDEDGWLHTGDLAKIDEDGYVRIVGRAKVVIKLATGKMISPAIIENMIVPKSRIIAQIILVGSDNRKYLTSIVVPYQKPLKEYADAHGIQYKSFQDLIYNREILNIIKEEILKLTEDVSDYQRPKKFAISCKDFRAEEGYLTPSYKFKREKLYKDLAKAIDEMYAQDDEFYIIKERLSDFYDQSHIVS
ncbi:MAG: AMP-dependent synthetase/ligase [Promethearchaeota archaeon]